MSTGLYIKRRSGFRIKWWGIVGAVVVVLLLTVGYYGYDWFVNGTKPPLFPLPASAYADTSVDESKVNADDIDKYVVGKTEPRYISIPVLNITKARVQKVGLTSLNTLEMPHKLDDAAWYTESSDPGQGFGQVVIDGHSMGVSRNGIFAGLDTLNDGDKITLERGDGKKITYSVVREVTMTLQDTNASGLKALMKPYNTSKEGLGLITDAGTWIPRDKVFNKRILVWAVAQ